MTKPTAKILIATLSLLLVAFADAAYGCSCIGESPCAAYSSAKAVFVGRLIGGTEKSTQKDQNGNLVHYEAGETRFAVEEVFKGVSSGEVSIFISTMKGSSCEWSGLIAGERYLVFAHEYNGQLIIGACNSTKQIISQQFNAARLEKYSWGGWYWNAEAGLKFLRSIPPTGTGGRVAISTQFKENTTAPSVTFTLSVANKTRYETSTNENGEAVLDGVAPGKYSVKATWPKGYAGAHQPEIEVAERGCSDLLASVFFSGVIKGQILDGHGQPAQSIRLQVESVSAEKTLTDTVTSDKNGKFEFNGLSAGKYRIYQRPEEGAQPTLFYPGVSDESKAKVITIATDKKNDDIEFKLPTIFKTQTITGKVAWPDGKPVANAYISLGCPIELEPSEFKFKVPEQNAKTDSQGNFKLTGFRGFSYSLKADAFVSEPNAPNYRGSVHAARVRLIVADEPIEVQLMLTEDGHGPTCDNDKRQRGQY